MAGAGSEDRPVLIGIPEPRPAPGRMRSSRRWRGRRCGRNSRKPWCSSSTRTRTWSSRLQAATCSGGTKCPCFRSAAKDLGEGSEAFIRLLLARGGPFKQGVASPFSGWQHSSRFSFAGIRQLRYRRPVRHRRRRARAPASAQL